MWNPSSELYKAEQALTSTPAMVNEVVKQVRKDLAAERDLEYGEQ